MDKVSLKDHMRSNGYEPPVVHIEPGRMYRFGKNNALWLKLALDRMAAFYGDWRTEEKFTWFAVSAKGLSHADIAEEIVRNATAKRERETKTLQRQTAAANEVQRLFAEAPAPTIQGYLITKQIEKHIDLFRLINGALVVPLETADGLINLQYIYPNGKKRFHPGGQIKGAYCVVHMPDIHTHLIICEGVATGCTLAQIDPTAIVFAAMTAGNLLPVAQAIRAHHPQDRIVIAGDNDRFTDGNPGKTKAIEAARAISAEYSIPEFPPGVDGTDFNDLMCAGALS